MTNISEFIKALENIKETYGDITVLEPVVDIVVNKGIYFSGEEENPF